jgi:diguanylate cyclase (GGDEF)-like protein
MSVNGKYENMITLSKSNAEINILIVDDQPANLIILSKILEIQGYNVRKCLTGEMALQSVHYHRPNLILLDVLMPDMNGYTVCQKLKESETTQHIPVIFITGLNRATDIAEAFEIGGQDFITKPFQEIEILARVKNQILIQQYQEQLEHEIQLRKEVEQKTGLLAITEDFIIPKQYQEQLEHEIQLRKEAEQKIHDLAIIDDVTGFYSRRGFFLLAQQQINLAERLSNNLVLIFIDLDGMNLINNSLKHKVGDAVITNAVNILRESFHRSDIIARLGDDEFLVLIVSRKKEDYQNLCNTIQARIDKFNQTLLPFKLDMNVGIQFYDFNNPVSLDHLITLAKKYKYKKI